MSRMEEHHGEHLWAGHSHLGAPTAPPRSTRQMSNIYIPSMPLQTNYSSVGTMGPRMGDRVGELPDQHTQSIPHRYPSDLSFQYSQHSPIASSPISNQYPTNGYISYPPSHLEQEFGHFSMPTSAPIKSTGSSALLNDSTLFMDNLEAWMDEHYVRSACKFMGWTPIAVNVPVTSSPQTSASTPNNAGYCFVTFANPSQAAAALTSAQASSGPVMMPNSSHPFALQWATRVSVSQLMQRQQVIASSAPMPSARSTPEYSIFVGDLAPEATNADLVAVFRNPVLGLRQDRQPKIVAPFTSCKSAKIMLDPATNVSKGYGFVRFTDEADQQRALVEMHGLYCLSRPMRISPATAKNKGTSAGSPSPSALGYPAQARMQVPFGGPPGMMDNVVKNAIMNASPSPPPPAPTSVTSMIAAQTRGIPREPDAVAEMIRFPPPVPTIYDNIIGPNGEQLTSSDPYNTTVFVGGLSPLINEETLRSFFAPFGEIHYVKVPAGKHCGFVQFVRKVDAERAIEVLNGFPIAGSRIRLSWGRSQFKAAQAAAQAQRATQIEAALANLNPHIIPYNRGVPEREPTNTYSYRPEQPPTDLQVREQISRWQAEKSRATHRGTSSGSGSPYSSDSEDIYHSVDKQSRFAGRSPDRQAAVYQRGRPEQPTAAGLNSSIWAMADSREDHDIQDLNGTLASLGIHDPQSSWNVSHNMQHGTEGL